ncbi:hypothetical protein IJ00_07950 [Calothrix sp. 336/3]|nr:hypothetical protein IJ00_07950 [Calothrix sp. 336/3]
MIVIFGVTKGRNRVYWTGKRWSEQIEKARLYKSTFSAKRFLKKPLPEGIVGKGIKIIRP